MIVHDLDIVRDIVLPVETDSPLTIDPNAVLALAISSESLGTISRRNSKIVKRFRCVEVKQFPPCHTLKDLKLEHGLVFK